MADVFISYSRRDIAFVQRLQHALTAAGRDVWVDTREIAPSAEWMPEIRSAIEAALAVVVVLSPDYASSEVCAQELDFAVANNKRLIPVVWREVPPGQLAPPLQQLNWLFLREGGEAATEEGFAVGVASLVAALAADFEWARTHTRLLLRATEWGRRGRERSLLLRGKDLREAEAAVASAGTREPRVTPLQQQYVYQGLRASQRGQRFRLLAVSGALVVALILAAFAFFQRNEAANQRDRAEAQQRVATSRQLAAQSQLLRRSQPEAIEAQALLAIEAARFDPSFEARQALIEADGLLPPRPAARSLKGGHAIVVAATTADVYAAGSDSGDVVVVDTATGKETWRGKVPRPVKSLALSGNGRVVAIGSGPRNEGEDSTSADAVVRFRDVQTGTDGQLAHQAPVTSVALDGEGRTLLSGTTGGELLLWDVSRKTSQVVRRADALDRVRAVALSPDGRYAAALTSKRIELFDLRNGNRSLGPFQYPSVTGFGLAFSPDSKLLLAGGIVVKLATLEKGTVIDPGFLNVQSAAAFSGDGSRFAVARENGALEIWDAAGLKREATVAEPGRVDAIAFGPDAAMVVTIDRTRGAVRAWDAFYGTESARAGVTGGAWSAAFMHDGQALVTGGLDGGLLAFPSPERAAYGRRLQAWTKGEGIASARGLSPNARWAGLSAGDDEQLSALNLATNQPVSLGLTGSLLIELIFSPDGTRVAVQDHGGDGPAMVHLLRLPSGEPIQDLEAGSLAYADATWSPDSSLLALTSDDGKSVRLVTRDGEAVRDWDTGERIETFAFSRDATRLLTVTTPGELTLWDVRTGEERQHASAGGRASIAISSGADLFAAAELQTTGHSEASTTHLWRMSSGEEVATIAHRRPVQQLTFSADGHYLAAASLDGGLVLFDTRARAEVATFQHPGGVAAASFSSDGSLLASATQDGSVHLWDVAGRRELMRTEVGYPVDTVAIADDNSRLAVMGSGNLDVLSLDPAALSKSLCGRLTRNLTEAEWRQYLPGQPYHQTCEGL